MNKNKVHGRNCAFLFSGSLIMHLSWLFVKNYKKHIMWKEWEEELTFRKEDLMMLKFLMKLLFRCTNDWWKTFTNCCCFIYWKLFSRFASFISIHSFSICLLPIFSWQFSDYFFIVSLWLEYFYLLIISSVSFVSEIEALK